MRRGLTLIELLVTIVIMVTVLAGVLPLLSPNNNARKIREASRQLNSLIQQAQAQAAREGRPAGISFTEFAAPGNFTGMSLEAFMIAEPPPFAGFSEHSRAHVTWPAGATYSSSFEDAKFRQYTGMPLCQIDFTFGSSPLPSPPAVPTNADPLPPRTFQPGDIIDIDGRQFLIADDDDPETAPNQLDEEDQDLDARMLVETPSVVGIWTNYKVGDLPPLGARFYRIRRQPGHSTGNTSDPPLQFPRGIGIDLQASGTSGGPDHFDDDSEADRVDIIFDANGAMESFYFNGLRRDGVRQVYLLLGAFENGNGRDRPEDFDFLNNGALDRDNLAQRRGRINWLNADSKWIAINSKGRVVVSNNNISFDPSTDAFLDSIQKADDPVQAQIDKQINFARQYADDMQQEGGR